MPIDFTPRRGIVNVPRSGALKDAWNTALEAHGRDTGSMLSEFGVFEPNQTIKTEQGRLEFNSEEIIPNILKAPAYTLEAPLRPLNVATDGGLGEAILGLPIVGPVLEGVGSVLETSNKAGRAWVNQGLASRLARAHGKPDDFVIETHQGRNVTAGWVRERAQETWGVNAFSGEQFSLEQLTSRAIDNPWNFGEFDTSPDGFTNFMAQVLADPLNIALLGGGAVVGGARAGLKLASAAPWARPAVNLGTRAAGAPRIGYGAIKSLGRVVEQTPAGARFLDEYSSARQVLNGALQEHGTLSGMLRATSWMMRGLYAPGYAGNVARGMSRSRAGLTAYMRGSIQQQLGTTAIEHAAGMANGWVADQGLENNVNDGFTSWLYDTMHAINNNHPLSDNHGFAIVALFSPWPSAIADIGRAAKQTRTANGLPRYADTTLFHVKDEFRRMFNDKRSFDDIFNQIGKGDIVQGRAAWEWFTDHMEALKASNQFSNFTRTGAETIEDIAQKQAFLTETVVKDIVFKRQKGALQPKSLADYMLDAVRDGPTGPSGDRLVHQFEITPNIFWDRVGDLYSAHQQFAPQLQKVGTLQLEQGAPLTQEIFDGMISMLDGLPEQTVPRDVAARIMNEGASLVWEQEFWRRFSATLGQMQNKSGRFARARTAAEGNTVSEIRAKLVELRESSPPAAELYHESVAASRRAVRIRPSETLLSQAPYPLPQKLDARRVYNSGRVKQLHTADRTITNIRNAEFFKNGRSRLTSAKEMSGHQGGHFVATSSRGGTKVMRRSSDGAEWTVQDGVLGTTVLDSEIIVLGARSGGRTTVRPITDGTLLANHGFVESARIKGTNMASYAYRGGDVTKIIENQALGVFKKYVPAKRLVSSDKAAKNAARRSANEASLLYPSMEAIGPSVTKAGRHLNPEERLKELNVLQDTIRAQRKSLVKQISEADELAMKILGVEKGSQKLGDYFDHASKTEINEALTLIKDVNRDFPSMSVSEGQRMWVDPRADRFSVLMAHRNLYRRLAFDYGHLSPATYLYTSLLAPIPARFLGKQTQTEIHNLLAQSGYSSKESSNFVALLRDRVMESRSAPGSLGALVGQHMYRTILALPEGTVRTLLEQAAPGKSAEVIARWGNAQKMITEAGNRLLRNSNRRARSGGKVDPLNAAMNGAFRIWQYAPGLEVLSSATRHFAKFIYPLIRFGTDPFYMVMNIIEPDMYGITMEGVRSSRWSKGVVDRRQSATAAEQASLTSIPPGGLASTKAADMPVDLLLGDAGAYTMPAHMRPIIERHFDIKRLDSSEAVWRAVKDEHPGAVVMREHFGDDVADWAQAADEMMYGYITRGPEETVRQHAKRVFDEMGITKDEIKVLAPVIERLASAHRGHYSDLVQLYVGRMNRSNLERTLDHFFLFWPLSYQIKATTWLATIMFNRIGGLNTGMAPAAMWKEYSDRWNKEVERDYDLRTWLEDNESAVFASEMLFPMTPGSIGISLSRPTRYVGSWIADGLEINPELKRQTIGEYDYVRTIPEMIENSALVGPIRTERLFKRIMDDFEVPGFTYPGRPEETSDSPFPTR